MTTVSRNPIIPARTKGFNIHALRQDLAALKNNPDSSVWHIEVRYGMPIHELRQIASRPSY